MTGACIHRRRAERSRTQVLRAADKGLGLLNCAHRFVRYSGCVAGEIVFRSPLRRRFQTHSFAAMSQHPRRPAATLPRRSVTGGASWAGAPSLPLESVLRIGHLGHSSPQQQPTGYLSMAFVALNP